MLCNKEEQFYEGVPGRVLNPWPRVEAGNMRGARLEVSVQRFVSTEEVISKEAIQVFISKLSPRHLS